MSLIENVATEFVGFFGNRPVYRCLQNVSLTDADGQDHSFSSFSFCIGDGDKFPLLFIKSAYRAIFHFAITHPSFDYSEWHDGTPNYEEAPDDLMRFMTQKDKDGNLSYISWNEQDHKDFERLCRSEFLVHPYSDDCGLSMDDWLHVGIGELIFNAMPVLVNLTTMDIAACLLESFTDLNVPLKYNNVWQVPGNAAHPMISENAFKHQYFARVWESGHLIGDVIAGNGWDFEDAVSYIVQLEEGSLPDLNDEPTISVSLK